MDLGSHHYVNGAAPEEASWGFEPDAETHAYGGRLEVRIPVTLSSTKGLFLAPLNPFASGADIVKQNFRKDELIIEVDVNDGLTRKERDAYVYPSDFPLAMEWPFTFRVDAFDHRGGDDEEDASKKKYTRKVTRLNINIYALNGVKVTAFYRLKSWGDSQGVRKLLTPSANDLGALFMSYRVDKLCRPESLPHPEFPVESRQLYPSHPVFLKDLPRGGQPLPGHLKLIGNFLVSHRPNGVDINWLATQQTIQITLPEPGNQNAAFTYWFNPNPKVAGAGKHLVYDDLLHIHVSGKVDIHVTKPVALRIGKMSEQYLYRGIKVDHPNPEAALGSNFLDPIAWTRHSASKTAVEKNVPYIPISAKSQVLRDLKMSRFFRVKRHDQAKSLPSFEEPAPISATDRREKAKDKYADYLKPKPEKPPLLIQLGTDIGLALLAPGVSDVADFAELNLAMATGKDKWGNKVEDWEIYLMSLSTVPIAGLGATLLRRLLKLFF